ncbi:MAG TPA: response regulator [Deltaproteobacteria bacterium]|nr:response regulator [Deltaproteobacteria bacterium]HOM27982.1 response regulator [Deltaproteobacteria bacterium]HPP79937.1 response regulator [Deltaproteobacteria bacterium]
MGEDNELKKRILVVDDEEIVRYSLKNILAARGYEVDDVPSAERALELFREKTYHLVLTDLVLEGMGGLELLENVKVISPRTLVIVITGYGSLKTAIRALRLGVYDYLLKPCEEEELVLRVKRALEMQNFGMEQQRLQELSAIAKTAVTLSDRINTPLSIILGNIEMLQLKDGVGTRPDVRETLRLMEEQVFVIKRVMEKLANLTIAHTKKYPALMGCEIIDLAREDSHGGGQEHPDR